MRHLKIKHWFFNNHILVIYFQSLHHSHKKKKTRKEAIKNGFKLCPNKNVKPVGQKFKTEMLKINGVKMYTLTIKQWHLQYILTLKKQI
jgi:hypothetical protein